MSCRCVSVCMCAFFPTRCLPIYICFCLSAFLNVCACVYLSVCLSLSVCVSLFLSFFLCRSFLQSFHLALAPSTLPLFSFFPLPPLPTPRPLPAPSRFLYPLSFPSSAPSPSIQTCTLKSSKKGARRSTITANIITSGGLTRRLLRN